MRITKQTDYSLRVLIYLASRPHGRVPTKIIAEAHDISLNHLHKVVSLLGELGYLRMYRGANGGAELARKPEDIFIGKVMRAIDDTTGLIECFNAETDRCVISPACGLKTVLKRAQKAFYAELDPVSLAVIVKGSLAGRLRSLTAGD